MKKFNFIILILLASFLSAFSQVPAAFNYQAVVRNVSGELIVNQNVSFRISILQDSESGASVYVETQSITTNSFGLANLKIGQGAVVSGNFSPAGWGSNLHFIEVEMDPTGGNAYAFLGSSELLSVPYALHAQTVEEDAVNDADADTTNELQSLSISGSDLSISDGNTVTLPVSESRLWTESGSSVYRSSGNVGISTSSPSAKLHVALGDVLVDENLNIGKDLTVNGGNFDLNSTGENWLSVLRGDGQNAGIAFKEVGAARTQWIFPYFRGWQSDNLIVRDEEAGKDVMTFEAGTGNVKIDSKIQITDGSQGDGKVLTSDASGLASWQTPASSSSLWTASGDNILYSNGSVNVGDGFPEHSILFQAKTNSDLYSIGAINNGTNPTIYAMNNGSGPSAWIAGKVRITDGTQGAGKILTSDIDGNASWQTPASCSWSEIGNFVYRSSGNVGIGTSDPRYARLEIRNQSTDNGIYVQSYGGSSIVADAFTSQGIGIKVESRDGVAIYAKDNDLSAKLCDTYSGAAGNFSGNVIIQNGNLGIGTTSPSQKLEVSGNIALSGGADRTITLPDGTKSLFIGGVKNQTSAYAVHLVTNSTSGGVPRLTVVSDKVGINTTSPSQNLDVNGNVRVRGIGSGAYYGVVNRTSDGTLTTASSDIRLKENISTLNNSLEKVLQLRGVNFTWKSNPEYGTRIGFIAQEFEKVIPELIFTNEVDGYKGINYAEVNAVLVEALKEQQKIIENLQMENKRLREKLVQFDTRISEIECTLKIPTSK